MCINKINDVHVDPSRSTIKKLNSQILSQEQALDGRSVSNSISKWRRKVGNDLELDNSESDYVPTDNTQGD